MKQATLPQVFSESKRIRKHYYKQIYATNLVNKFLEKHSKIELKRLRSPEQANCKQGDLKK